MREQVVAWAGDCMVLGSVELEEGRLSDQLNEREVVTFYDAALRSLDDGREVVGGEAQGPEGLETRHGLRLPVPGLPGETGPVRGRARAGGRHAAATRR